MQNLNTMFLHDIYNSFYINTPKYLENLEITPKVNSELRSYSINLGRRSGKTTAILDFISKHPETKFVLYSPNSQHILTDHREKYESLTNCILRPFTDRLVRHPYDILILEDYTYLAYNMTQTLGVFENKVYTRMNMPTRKDQIYIKVG